MTLIKTAFCAVLFGSLYTIFRKFQSVIKLNENSQQFNQPILQSFIIFIGMATITFFRPWMNKQKQQAKKSSLPSDNKYIYIIPSLLDVLGTIVDTAGLYYTSVSVSQMLKGSVLFFTYIITLFYLKKSLIFKKHLYMILILISLTIIGSSNVSTANSKYQSSPLLGNILIIISQLLFSLMFIYEEKILKQYQIKIQNCVFWQGIWGALLSGIILIVFSFIQTPIKSNVIKSCFLICHNWKLLMAVLLTAVTIGPFNYFGISLTKQGSALQRCMICTMRMIVVWIISLAFQWQKFHLIQLIGYCLLTWGIYKFNNCDIPPQQNAEVPLQQQMRLNQYKEQCSDTL